jgi:hypothetical protein
MIEVAIALWESEFVRLLVGLILGSIAYVAIVERLHR